MCCIYEFAVCGHRDIDRNSCTNPNPVTNPCKPTSTAWKLPSECSRCRESFLRSVAKRSSVMTRQVTRAALDLSTAPPSLFAWPEPPARKQMKPSRRGPLRSNHLAGIPESPTIVKENRGWSAGFRKPLPCLPTPVETLRDFSPKVLSSPKPAQSFPQRNPPPRVASTQQKTASLPPSLAISKPQNKAGRPSAPAVLASQHTVSLPPRHVTTIPQHITQTRSSAAVLPPSSAGRVQPRVDRTDHQLKGSCRSGHLRDAYQDTDRTQASASAYLPIACKPLQSYPAWTTLPSQIEERTKEAGVVWRKTQTEWDQRQASHTPSQELFLTTPVKGTQTHLDRGEFPSCLQPADQSQASDLSRLSTLFNLFNETGREASIECETREPATITPRTFIAYSGVPAVKSASGIPLQSYATHAPGRAESVEFEGRKTTATPTTYIAYSPKSSTKSTQRFSAPAPVKSETTASTRDGSLTSEKRLSELSAIFNLASSSKSYQDAPIEFVSPNSDRDPYSTYAPTSTLDQAKSLSELSAIFDMETCEAQIELETYSRLTTSASPQQIKVSDGTYACYNPLTATFAVEAVSG